LKQHLFSPADHKYMKVALKLSRSGMGFTEPNPMVGAVVVKGNKILSTGYHSSFGARHAEQMALAPVKQAGTTLYVTLEPCAHHGKTAPCSDLIISKKVKRVVVSLIDPNPLVNGKGIACLEASGIQVDLSLYEEVAKEINRHYLKYIVKNIPYVAIHAGVSLDGKLTDRYKISRWVTSRDLRKYSHSIRGEYCAILAGANTIREDNPQLTVREKGWQGKRLYRVVLDSQNSLDPTFKIFKNQSRFPLIIFSSSKAKNKTARVKHHYFINCGPDGLDLKQVLQTLSRIGISSLLVEGGGQVIDAFLRQRLYDEIILFTANTLLGGEKAVQLFASGEKVSRPLVLRDVDILTLENGCVIRGYR
jgi:diaminohydroxyphosphoribosylaminopyrimidine deaminase/5-amino-6-(5-phosphoribosylamino)uracil reductase